MSYGPDIDEDEDEDQSGMMDYERHRWEEEQQMLRADPAFLVWLESIDKPYEQEMNHGDHGI